MIHVDNRNYRISAIVSSKNFRKKEGATRAPIIRRPGLVKSLNKFYELCGFNDSEAARRLGIKPQQFNEWRRGLHSPTRAAISHLATKVRTSESNLLAGDISESAASYEKPLTSHERKMLAAYEALMNSGDDEIVRHLDRQIELLTDLMNRRKMNPDDKR